MTTSSVFLVTYNDGDYYTRHDKTLAAFTSRVDAAGYALSIFAADLEVYGEVQEGFSLVERVGEDEISRVDVLPIVGCAFDDPLLHRGLRVTDRDAVYRSLERILFS